MDPLRLVGLKAVFGSHPEIDLIADSAVDILDDRQTQIVLVGTYGGNRVAALLDSLRIHRPEIKVLIMSPVTGDEGILHALSMGAKGFLHETSNEFELEQAIRAVAQGSIWASRRILSLLIEELLSARQAHTQRGSSAFTQREREVLDLLLVGLSNREIARKLAIEERTVKAYVAKLMAKVGVKNRTALSMHTLTRAGH